MRLFHILNAACALTSMFIISACGSSSNVATVSRKVNINLEYSGTPERHFNGVTYGIRPEVMCNIPESGVVRRQPDTQLFTTFYRYSVSPEIGSYASYAIRRFAADMGFSNVNSASERILAVNIREFNVSPGFRSTATVVLDYELLDPSRNILMSSRTVTGRYILDGNGGGSREALALQNAGDGAFMARLLNGAFVKALSEINWTAIANLLTVHSTAEAEPERRVRGDGDTALENTIIRWYIISSPMGADVSWRVVSSTPAVHNTNSAYMGTTPYETTESFDIRGLTLENSGNVQIEIKCEKPGYLPQTKRFNLRQAIDQREISAKFNLVSE